MGKPHDPDYFKKYRANHPEYRQRQARLRNERRARQGRGDRSSEYLRRKSRAAPPLPDPFAHLRHGKSLSFWEDELKMDLSQERELALLEGVDPDAAVAAYRIREMGWKSHIADLPEER